MFKTLYRRLAIVFLALLCLLGMTLSAGAFFVSERYRQEVYQQLNRPLAAQLVSENPLLQHTHASPAALQALFNRLLSINPGIDVYLLDQEGNVRRHSAPPEEIKRHQVNLTPLQDFLKETRLLPILGDDPRDPQRREIFSIAPLPAEGQASGYLYVILKGDKNLGQLLQSSYFLKLSLWVIAASVALALLTGLGMFAYLTRRLRRLAAAMETFNRSGFTAPVTIPLEPIDRPGDEIDRLVTVFNHMAEHIAAQMRTFKHDDRLRRELVANISHDLRTPLTSLQGYLETLLLQEGSLSPQEQRNYLEIAAKHSERLGKLVGDLFMLAKLDANEVQPHREIFSMGELSQDVMQKFLLKAEQKQVRLVFGCAAEVPFVDADIGLIERVLENLIENALRHTPEDGTIHLSLLPAGRKLMVRVADTGCGIPAAEVPYIFDRFYRSESNRPERSGSSGLGLAIAKRILKLHGSNIQVESTVNVGTVFTFELPLAGPSDCPRRKN